MKKMLCLCLILMLLSGCGAQASPTTEPTTVPTTVPATTVPETTVPATTVPETTLPPHSELYLPEYTVEQIIEYFCEVVLDLEYSDGEGDVTLVQKWCAPILYRFRGDPTDEDLAVLEELFAQLNAIPDFPEIRPATVFEMNNLTLNFLNEEELNADFEDVLGGEYAFGAVQFWYYTANNEIHTARIGYRTDIGQTTRNSVLIEEIINMLGISDSELREDSIVYQHSNANLSLSDVDWVILKLLYDPAIQCGMGREECEAVIRELYY